MKTNKFLVIFGGGGVVLLIIIAVSALTGGEGVTQRAQAPILKVENPTADRDANKLMAIEAHLATVRSGLEKKDQEIAEVKRADLEERKLNDALQAQVQELTAAIHTLKKQKAEDSTKPAPVRTSEQKLEGSALVQYEDTLQRLAGAAGSVDLDGATDKAVSVFDQYARAASVAGAGSDAGAAIDNPRGNFIWHKPQNRPELLQENRQNNVTSRTAAAEKQPDPVKKMYTIPANATGFEAKALGVMVGRIPVNGETPAPYRVKVMIGPDAFAANGFFFDNLEGMIVSGWATGDFNLSCVDVSIDSYLYVFTDGTIVSKAAENQKSSNRSDRLGYLSMGNGFPCVPGNYKGNAPSYLAQSSVLRGLKVAGEAYSSTQTTLEDLPLGGGRSAVTGDAGKYVLGKTASGAVDESIAYVRQMQGRSFDAIVANPGQSVVVHFEKQIEIDYDPNGRKVVHEENIQDFAYSSTTD